MQITTNKKFNSREDLDRYIKNTHGDNSNNNKEISIEARAEELKKLALSEKTNVFGVKIKKTK